MQFREGGGGICPKCPILDPPLKSMPVVSNFDIVYIISIICDHARSAKRDLIAFPNFSSLTSHYKSHVTHHVFNVLS